MRDGSVGSNASGPKPFGRPLTATKDAPPSVERKVPVTLKLASVVLRKITRPSGLALKAPLRSWGTGNTRKLTPPSVEAATHSALT